jgi:hypothetical protein
MEHRPVVDTPHSDLNDLPPGHALSRPEDYAAPAVMTEAQRLIAAGRLLRATTLVGNPARSVERLDARMRNPRPGDIVWETSTSLRSLRDAAWAERAVGWYVTQGQSPWVSREEWEGGDCEWREDPGQPYEECPTRLVWVIRPWGNPDGEFTWENAELLALPLDWPAEEMFR